MKIVKLIIISIFFQVGLYGWPGDQDSLSCIPEEDYNNPKNRNDIKAQFNSTGAYATNGKTAEENRQLARERIKTIARANHDMDYRVTKLGDSLSDLVDFYGVAIPRNVFPNYGDAAGYLTPNLFYLNYFSLLNPSPLLTQQRGEMRLLQLHNQTNTTGANNA